MLRLLSIKRREAEAQVQKVVFLVELILKAFWHAADTYFKTLCYQLPPKYYLLGTVITCAPWSYLVYIWKKHFLSCLLIRNTLDANPMYTTVDYVFSLPIEFRAKFQSKQAEGKCTWDMQLTEVLAYERGLVCKKCVTTFSASLSSRGVRPFLMWIKKSNFSFE